MADGRGAQIRAALQNLAVLQGGGAQANIAESELDSLLAALERAERDSGPSARETSEAGLLPDTKEGRTKGQSTSSVAQPWKASYFSMRDERDASVARAVRAEQVAKEAIAYVEGSGLTALARKWRLVLTELESKSNREALSVEADR